jgi:hypothetical protein
MIFKPLFVSPYVAESAAQTRTEAQARAEIAEKGKRAFFDVAMMRTDLMKPEVPTP